MTRVAEPRLRQKSQRREWTGLSRAQHQAPSPALSNTLSRCWRSSRPGGRQKVRAARVGWPRTAGWPCAQWQWFHRAGARWNHTVPGWEQRAKGRAGITLVAWKTSAGRHDVDRGFAGWH